MKFKVFIILTSVPRTLVKNSKLAMIDEVEKVTISCFYVLNGQYL